MGSIAHLHPDLKALPDLTPAIDIPACKEIADLFDLLRLAAKHVYLYYHDEPKATVDLYQYIQIGYEHLDTLILHGGVPGLDHFKERVRTMTLDLAQHAE